MPIPLVADLIIAERFRLNRPLGQGAMGSVWHATHLGLETPCALKFIEGEYATHPEASARFELEAKAAARLRSPNVVQILDHGVFQGMPYIAMELLEGEDLAQRLDRAGKLRTTEAVGIALQICRALTKAHASGIVHRDLKPANVFLVRDDDREIAKVLDFGIAKASGGIDASSTKTGAILGTPSYMSPEQAQGTKTVDHRSDLWSLAVIVYECVTGQLPFESEALGDLFLKIMINPLPIPSQVAPGLAPGFDAWWQRAAARDPQERFQSARELGDSLAHVFGLAAADAADGDSFRAVFPTPTSAVTRVEPAKTSRTALKIAGAGVFAGIAIGAVLLFGLGPNHKAAPIAAVVPRTATLTTVATDLQKMPVSAPVTVSDPAAAATDTAPDAGVSAATSPATTAAATSPTTTPVATPATTPTAHRVTTTAPPKPTPRAVLKPAPTSNAAARPLPAPIASAPAAPPPKGDVFQNFASAVGHAINDK